MYIAVATIEMAFLNGYMWIAAVNHSWGLNYQPFLVIFVNTFIRGIMIAIVIAIRWNMAEMSHPTRTRDATEIYDATADLDNDADHDDDIPTIYEMRRDIFT
nr:Bm2097 [Brugia malayi]